MLAYYGTQLSPHMDRTPEGYLICRDVPIARTGPQEYLAGELGLEGDPERVVEVNRYPEDVFDPAVLASFEGKDVTAGHPPENVGPENFSSYTRGHVQNVRRSGEHIVADLIIKDANLVSDVWNGVTREVSCGYLCRYVPDGSGYKQQHIRGTHVAVVPRGRAGHEVAIQDQAVQETEKGETHMDEENKKTAATSAPDETPEEKQEAGDACAQDAEAERAPADGGLGSKLDKVIEMLGALQRRSGGEEEQLHDENTIDAAIARLDGAQAVTIPAETEEPSPVSKDAAVKLLKTMRPVVAGMKDAAERSRVVDALLSTIKGPDMVGQVVQAAQASAQKTAYAAQTSAFEARCRESEAAYAARNPHKKKED